MVLNICMSKLLRQELILELVQTGTVASQEDLRSLLGERGCEVTQSTLSRELKDLGLVKSQEGYRLPGDESAGNSRDALEASLARYLLRCIAVQNQVLMRTAVGNAQPLALALDQSDFAGLLGTIAGDDTILGIAPDAETARKIADQLLTIANGHSH